MWMWPLDSIIGATTAHRAPEGVVDRTCTQVWVWMTNKYRERMNQKKWYITLEISHKGAGGCSWEVRLDGNSYPRTRSPSPWGIGPFGAVFLAPTWSSPTSTQAVAPSEPSFWTHSLQIHCNGSAGPKSHPPLGPVWKPWSYNWRRLWEELLVRWWVQQFVKAGLSPLGEVMVASLLYHKERTARWFIA